MKIAIIGAGWAGMAAAVEARQAGHETVVFEASRNLGGRARSVNARLPNGTGIALDNGQHILIGAYVETLRLMRLVGIDPQTALLRLPMTLLFPDGQGLRFPPWPTPLDALGGILSARGWRMRDKWSLLRVASSWHRSRFQCDSRLSVAQLCQRLTPRVMSELIEPLCVSALNTPAERASAQVFLRVMGDALFGVQGGSALLLPRLDLSNLFPTAAARWISEHGGQMRMGLRVESVESIGSAWKVHGEAFDSVILATAASDAIRLMKVMAQVATATVCQDILKWTRITQGLEFEAITTVYAWAPEATLTHTMVTLRSHPGDESTPPAPAQFVFDRGQLGGPRGLLAFVVSASNGDRETLQEQVLRQAKAQLGLKLQAIQTIVEKRATFACTPGLVRPQQRIATGLIACGDYVQGPYPATLEGAIRSGQSTLTALGH